MIPVSEAESRGLGREVGTCPVGSFVFVGVWKEHEHLPRGCSAAAPGGLGAGRAVPALGSAALGMEG